MIIVNENKDLFKDIDIINELLLTTEFRKGQDIYYNVFLKRFVDEFIPYQTINIVNPNSEGVSDAIYEIFEIFERCNISTSTDTYEKVPVTYLTGDELVFVISTINSQFFTTNMLNYVREVYDSGEFSFDNLVTTIRFSEKNVSKQLKNLLTKEDVKKLIDFGLSFEDEDMVKNRKNYNRSYSLILIITFSTSIISLLAGKIFSFIFIICSLLFSLYYSISSTKNRNLNIGINKYVNNLENNDEYIDLRLAKIERGV